MKFFKKEPLDPDVEAAYDKAYKEERLLVAAQRGKEAAHKPAKKPFYRKLGDIAVNITKDFGKIRLSDQFYEDFNPDNLTPKPAKRKSK
jgi:hypothetical protein